MISSSFQSQCLKLIILFLAAKKLFADVNEETDGVTQRIDLTFFITVNRLDRSRMHPKSPTAGLDQDLALDLKIFAGQLDLLKNGAADIAVPALGIRDILFTDQRDQRS